MNDQARRRQMVDNGEMPRYALRSTAAWPTRPNYQWTFDPESMWLDKSFMRFFLYDKNEWTEELVRMAKFTWLKQRGATAGNWDNLYYVVKRFTTPSDYRAEVLSALRVNFERDVRHIRGAATRADVVRHFEQTLEQEFSLADLFQSADQRF
jgi:hypothetical protein